MPRDKLTPAERDAQPLTDAEREAVPGGASEVLAETLTELGEDGAADAEDERLAPDDVAVPRALRIAAAWAWRLIVVGVVLVAFGNVLALLGAVVLPLVIALLIAAPLELGVTWLEKLRVPRTLGAVVAVIGLLVAVLGLMTAVGASVATGFDSLRNSAVRGFDTVVKWLVDGPLHVSQAEIDGAVNQAVSTVRENAWGLASGAINVTGTVSALAAGVILALIALFFFIRDGADMWAGFVRIAPRSARAGLDRAGRAGWTTLRRYTLTSVTVAAIDAVGIGLGALVLAPKLALPIAILVFLTSFIPMFGASISGAVAVLVVLVDSDWKAALWMLGVVLLVQFLEGNLLYPLLFGRAAQVHPMAILLAVSAGTLLAGLAGAVIAVPIVSFGVAFARGLHREYLASQGEPHTLTLQLPVLRERSRKAVRTVRERLTTGSIRTRKPKQ